MLADVMKFHASDAIMLAYHLARLVELLLELGVLDVVDKSIRISLFEAVEETA